MTLDLSHTLPFLDMLAGREAVYDWRIINDKDRADYGQKLRGTLAQCQATLEAWNDAGHGIFLVVNETDGNGVSYENVRGFRAQFIDYDAPDETWSQYKQVAAWQLPPTGFVVAAVAGKFHAYWKRGDTVTLDVWQSTQRKLIERWQSDKAVSDPPRVMRLPGSLHMKAAPVTVQWIAGSGRAYSQAELDAQLATVSAGPDLIALGDASLAAPDLAWAVYALNKIDPNTLGREDWIKLSASFKQAAWSHADDATVTQAWRDWCARYAKNDVAENAKNWRSIRQTKTGWNYLAKVSGALPEYKFGGVSVAGQVPAVGTPAEPGDGSAPIGPFLTPEQQREHFAGCLYIERMGRILTPSRRYMDPGKFNASFGGPVFILDQSGAKVTDEPWKAATRGQVYRVARVDHTRFLPQMAPGAIVPDDLGRLGVNTYRPANVRMVPGDVSPFVNHLRLIIPTERDIRILINFFAHIVQRPGIKAFWAPVIQSSEGAGKGIILEALTYAVGSIYVHAPNAKELVDAGSKFNSWMLDKLLIIANEIRVDDKRDMLDALKPMITELRMEFQSKGIDQEMNDNVANWIMFTNFKDAIPIKASDRRYAIFYSTIQSNADLAARNMGGGYFPKLYAWLRSGGAAHIAHWLANWPIEPEFDPAGDAHRAPVTSSTEEALRTSLGRIEQVILAAVDDNLPGFRTGWLSSVMVARALLDAKVTTTPNALAEAFRGLGYHRIGRSGSAFAQEGFKQPWLYHKTAGVNMADYGRSQGYV